MVLVHRLCKFCRHNAGHGDGRKEAAHLDSDVKTDPDVQTETALRARGRFEERGFGTRPPKAKSAMLPSAQCGCGLRYLGHRVRKCMERGTIESRMRQDRTP